ncbi:hypothetical protein CAL12_23795 [Bordetella genomosp. 8]|uniref:AbrB family transcriptional regulator n=1 Tax=Bordetella genomosp. 8 TaxID=1416806 RepID=A0A1W6YRA4_9BORD|nr:hypothetical protein [Bordetella genomosp. 8]ARP83531.1 hypothetical protein CAL12_23795 [Bordetella genomosp. 8]
MAITKKTKVFKSGNSWAVRLPSGFSFTAETVYITRDDATGAVTITEQPHASAWDAFFKLRDETLVPADYMADRPLNQPTVPGGIFDDWKE